MTFEPQTLEDALSNLGELLEERNQQAEIVVIGGGSLLLLGLLQRPTKDLDVVALIRDAEYQTARPLPDYLCQAVGDVGVALGLSSDWLNGGPTSLLDLGLPEGFDRRLVTKRFGALGVHVAGRLDQICFKLYAAVDQGPKSKHARDLEKLHPTMTELRFAAAWCRTHDPSEGFARVLAEALQAFGGKGGS